MISAISCGGPLIRQTAELVGKEKRFSVFSKPTHCGCINIRRHKDTIEIESVPTDR
jgi:hypothetical protein